MSREGQAYGNAFRRQVTFRIGPEDALLLDAAARAHGGIQAGILAALRAYGAQRVQAALPPEPPAEVEQPPAAKATREPLDEAGRRASATTAPARDTISEDELVELNVSEAAPVLGLSPAALRERIKRGAQEGRVAENGLYLARIPRAKLRASGVVLSPRGAAEVLGLKPSTIKSRCKAGRYPNARNDGLGWSIPASDIV